MKTMVLLLTFALSTMPAFAAPSVSDEPGMSQSADGRQIAARMPLPARDDEQSASSDNMSAFKKDLAADGTRFDDEMRSHVGRFKDFAFGEGSRFTSELSDQFGRMGQDILTEFGRVATAANQRMNEIWLSMPARLSELRSVSSQRFNQMRQSAGDEMTRFWKDTDNRLKGTIQGGG